MSNNLKLGAVLAAAITATGCAGIEEKKSYEGITDAYATMVNPTTGQTQTLPRQPVEGLEGCESLVEKIAESGFDVYAHCTNSDGESVKTVQQDAPDAAP